MKIQTMNNIRISRIAALLLLACTLFYAGCKDDNSPSWESFPDMEKQAFDLVNQYRVSKGLPAMEWSDIIADIARTHSRNMASGSVAFGHDGFADRFNQIGKKIAASSGAENVAWSLNYSDPAQVAYEGWLNSPGHLENIETAKYNISGMGIAKAADGKYYFTQIFIQK